ncbi:hypothetical protein BpHYR1_010547 [Brachionus plicatilis]|uniref:Uncharacterized protein n=1 Tax=Brachionus plicatilis TaxID=10195 RepID=A0A3M7T8X1_BRAPC|nr:hypothetical protein BpHYR1_010547 [Brachionus plicatilis]
MDFSNLHTLIDFLKIFQSHISVDKFFPFHLLVRSTSSASKSVSRHVKILLNTVSKNFSMVNSLVGKFFLKGELR